MNPKILPVIHYIDSNTALAEADKAFACGADGVFLISHHGNDMDLLEVGSSIRMKHPNLPIGINFLSSDVAEAANLVSDFGFPMFWTDSAGVNSEGVNSVARLIESCRLDNIEQGNPFDVFASVAFKYQPTEPDPVLAAINALGAGFIPTTSGDRTGAAPDISKIRAMSEATSGLLAIASGMTPENIAGYAPYVSHILVATGIATDEYRMSESRLMELIENSKKAV